MRMDLQHAHYKVWRVGDTVHVRYGHPYPTVMEGRRKRLEDALSAKGIVFEENPNGDTIICTGIKEG